MPTTTSPAPPTFRVSNVRPDNTVEHYDAPAATPAELIRSAMRYMNVTADGSSYEKWEAEMDEANRFATFCVGETVDETGQWCDPTRSFRDLWSKFLETNP